MSPDSKIGPAGRKLCRDRTAAERGYRGAEEKPADPEQSDAGKEPGKQSPLTETHNRRGVTTGIEQKVLVGTSDTAGGWRFVAPVAGMTVWLKDSELFARWTGTGWIDGEIVGSVLRLGDNQVVGDRQPAISDPSGGATVDIEARDVISLILEALRAHGLVAE